jgi:hypothetical protein
MTSINKNIWLEHTTVTRVFYPHESGVRMTNLIISKASRKPEVPSTIGKEFGIFCSHPMSSADPLIVV